MRNANKVPKSDDENVRLFKIIEYSYEEHCFISMVKKFCNLKAQNVKNGFCVTP